LGYPVAGILIAAKRDARLATDSVNKDLVHMTEREITEQLFADTTAR